MPIIRGRKWGHYGGPMGRLYTVETLWVVGRRVRGFSGRKMGVGWRGTGLGIRLMGWGQYGMGRGIGLKARLRGAICMVRGFITLGVGIGLRASGLMVRSRGWEGLCIRMGICWMSGIRMTRKMGWV
jgi:hypothetical protein